MNVLKLSALVFSVDILLKCNECERVLQSLRLYEILRSGLEHFGKIYVVSSYFVYFSLSCLRIMIHKNIKYVNNCQGDTTHICVHGIAYVLERKSIYAVGLHQKNFQLIVLRITSCYPVLLIVCYSCISFTHDVVFALIFPWMKVLGTELCLILSLQSC